MAKIIKVGSQTFTPNKIANPFKTSRVSTTNPFKYNTFEGNTIPLEIAADVFEGTKTQSTSKMRMIASSVAGSMNKMRSSITEPIINFVNRVRGGISNAWEYAKNTNVSDLFPSMSLTPALNKFTDVMNTPIEIKALDRLSDSAAELGKGISSKLEFLNKDIMEVGRDMKAQWANLIAKIPSKTHYTSATPVAELEAAWKEQIALGGAV